MFGRETFIVRVAEDAMVPRVRAGDYVWVDPDEPAADGRLVAITGVPTANELWPRSAGRAEPQQCCESAP